MATVADETELADVADPRQRDRIPDASVLEDKTPAWIRSSGATVVFVAVIGVVFLLMANRPLWHSDLWDHLNYGQHVLDHRAVSPTEPLLRLARGMPMVNIPWLAQVGMSVLHNRVGLSALQFVYGLLIAASLGIVAWRGTVRGGSVWAGLLACFILFALNYQQFLIIRPQLLGVVFQCATAAWLLSDRRRGAADWIGMPVLFAVWANCHGSFAVGLLTIAVAMVGEFCDVWQRSRSLRTAVVHPRVWSLLLTLQLCAAAVLLNPSGLAIYPEVLQVGANPNVDSMFEWNALSLRMIQGQWAAGMILVLLVALKLTPRRVRFAELLPLMVTGLLALWSARMINWWAPWMAIVTGTHLTAVLRAWRQQPRRTTAASRSGLWTVVCLGLCWILFALTNLGVQVVHGRMADPARLVSRQTPVQMVAFLNSQSEFPKGLAFVPAEWAGYVMNAGPQSLSPMVNLHVHVIPVEIWDDYLRLLQGPSDWESVLDQYGVNLVIVDRNQQPRLWRRLAESEDWKSLYQDSQAGVFRRNQPI